MLDQASLESSHIVWKSAVIWLRQKSRVSNIYHRHLFTERDIKQIEADVKTRSALIMNALSLSTEDNQFNLAISSEEENVLKGLHSVACFPQAYNGYEVLRDSEYIISNNMADKVLVVEKFIAWVNEEPTRKNILGLLRESLLSSLLLYKKF